MAELPRGMTLETRRGGPDVLRTLVEDFFADSQEGYIRIERTPKDQLPRVGQIIVDDGAPIAAIHEQSAVQFGLNALIEIEEDAMHVDALLTVVGEIDVAHIDSLFPEARLYIETAWSDNLPESVGERWWLQKEVREATWSKASDNALPEYEGVIEAPEFIQRAAAIRRAKMEGELCDELTPGQVLLLDATDNHNSFRLAAELAILGRPVLVLSRLPKERLVAEYGLPTESCWWLTEQSGGVEQACGARLEDITRTITDFLSDNHRAIVALDGLEFLSSVHGSDRMFGFLRRLVDTFRDSDDALMIPVDLLAWEEKEQRLLVREADTVSSSQVLQWLDDVDNLATHPLCAQPTDEEIAWVEAALKTAEEMRQESEGLTQKEAPIGSANRFSAEDFAQEWLQEGEGEQNKDVGDATNEDWVPTFHSAQSGEIVEMESIAEEEHEEEEVEEITPPIQSKPRQPNRLGKRREVQSPTLVNSDTHELKRSELKAAVDFANEVDSEALEIKSSLLDNRLAKAKKSLEAVGIASSIASERIDDSSLPTSERDTDRERRIGEWEQAVVAGKGKTPRSIPEPLEDHDAWEAAIEHARNPLQKDPTASSAALSPLISRPGVKVDLAKKGRDSAHRTQKDMGISSIARRVEKQDETRNKYGKVVTDIDQLEES